MAGPGVEAVLGDLLAEGERVRARADGISARWFPFTFPGQLLAQAVTVVLTDRRVLLLDVSRFSNREAWPRFVAPLEAARATFKPSVWRTSWLWGNFVQRWGGLLRLTLADDVVRVYVDRGSREVAAQIAEALARDRPAKLPRALVR